MAYVEWFTREYIARNGVCEKTKFPLHMEGEPSARSGREYKRRIRKAEKNATQAKHEAARTANDNFLCGRDHLITATMDDAWAEELERRIGTSWESDPDAWILAVRKEIGNWIRRARRRMPEGGELKYLAFPADLDGKTLAPVRPHIHVIVNEEGAAALAESWGHGYVYGTEKKLYSAHHGDLTDLIEYLLNQCRTVGTEKRYIPSRNLTKPEATRPRPAKNPDAELRVPKGAQLIFRSEQRAGRPQKIRYYRPEKDRSRQAPCGNSCGGDVREVMRE